MNPGDIPTLPARDWNAVRAAGRSHRPLPGRNVRLRWTSEGVLLELVPAGDIHHAWELAPRWREDAKLSAGGEWVSPVRPGFVNGADVSIEVDGVHQPLTEDPSPEIALGSFRDLTASAGFAATAEGELITLPGEGYPEVFAALGAKPVAPAPPDPARTRRIVAGDLVLITPRFAARQEVTVLDPFTDAATAQISTTFLNGRIASAPSLNYLVTLPKWVPTDVPSALDRLAGTAVESEQDELLIATYYFLSPPETDDTAPVDETWEPFVVYHVWWNLAHASRAEVGTQPDAPISLHLGLAFGLGDALYNFLLSPVNDALGDVLAALNAADFTGLYWTPGTIGGQGVTASAAGTLAAPQTTGGLGLNPLAIRLAKEARTAAAHVVPPLNPAFPWSRLLFDPPFFGMENEAP